MEPAQAQESNQTKRAAIGGLAVVGFIALILIGVATAIYAASFLPNAFSRLTGANVYLSTLLTPSDTGTTTNSGAPSSVPLSPAPATEAPGAANPTYTTSTGTNTGTTHEATTPSSHTPAQTTYRPVAVPVAPTLYGLPDLVTTVTSTGYLRITGDATSFVPSDTVPAGSQGAVRFVVANRGTNAVGAWNFEANLPTNDNASDYRSAYQRALNPGDSMVFTLGFDSTTRGTGSIRVIADPDNLVAESNESNNGDSTTVYLTGTNYANSYDRNASYCVGSSYYSNGRFYCTNSSGTGAYDSNGTYCAYGTYTANGRRYCDSAPTDASTPVYDSAGNYCAYGTYTQNGRTYCNSNGTDRFSSGSYDSNGRYCAYGTYYQNGRYICQ